MVACIAVITGLLTATAAEDDLTSGGRLEVINYSDHRIPAMVINVGEARGYFSLEANQRAEVVIPDAADAAAVKRTHRGTANWDADRERGIIANGVLRLDQVEGEWSLAFVSPETAEAGDSTLLEKCHLDAWLDAKPRGRVMESDPESLGMVAVKSGRIIRADARGNPDGSATLEIVRTFAEPFEDIVWTENLTLMAGEPILVCKNSFTNRGNSVRYIAYTGVGAGLSGRFGRLIRQEPILKFADPAVTSGILVSGDSNQFDRLAWRKERAWVGIGAGNGIGFGVATTENITRYLPGNTVWSFLSDRFHVPMLDLELDQPYELTPGATFENTIALLVTSAGVPIREQTQALWKSFVEGRRPHVANAAAAFLDGEPISPAEVATFETVGGEHSKFIRNPRTDLLTAPLTMNFDRQYELVATATGASSSHPLIVTAQRIDDEDASPVEILRLENSQPQRADFSALTNWPNERVTFHLRVANDMSATIQSLRLAPKAFPAPALSSPSNDLTITNIAAFFRWKGVPGALDYELQLARDGDFAGAKTHVIRSEIEWPIFIPEDAELPEAGDWAWRVRAVEPELPGEWSEPRRLRVTTDLPIRPPIVAITPQNPLLTIEAFGVEDFTSFGDTIPADIRENTAIKIDQKFGLVEMVKPLVEADQKVFIRSQSPIPVTAWVPLADLEELFQKYPQVIGAMAGESLSFWYRGGIGELYTTRLLKLCGKYGRIYYEADGTYPKDDKWERVYEKKGDLLREYSGNLVFAQKNNILHRQFVSQSSVLGLYLAGAIANLGAWEDGGWYWQQVGFRALGDIRGQRGGDTREMPKNFWNLTFLMGLSQGAAIFSLDGQTGTVPVPEGFRIEESELPANASPSGYWTRRGELTPVFHRYIAPFFRAVLHHQLVPTKGQVMDRIRVGVFNDISNPQPDPDPFYDDYWALFAGTYGYRDIGVHPGELMEFFPDSGRYYYIPIFPVGSVDLESASRLNKTDPLSRPAQLTDATGTQQRVEVLPLSRLQDPEGVRELFDRIFPPSYEGDALVSLVGDTLTIMNSHENTDESQTYAIPLKRGIFQSVEGSIEPHAYVMGKLGESGDNLWLQANVEYADRPTEMVVRCTSAPAIVVEPAAAKIAADWRSSTGSLRLVLDHQHGVVEVTLSSQP